mmetsp:Transcript_17812/g.42401  ORF Transcript_17812/g.42401 Transcript_17812/m.42401 type:complete len:258 (+) Transcript_17812:134-907(+)
MHGLHWATVAEPIELGGVGWHGGYDKLVRSLSDIEYHVLTWCQRTHSPTPTPGPNDRDDAGNGTWWSCLVLPDVVVRNGHIQHSPLLATVLKSNEGHHAVLFHRGQQPAALCPEEVEVDVAPLHGNAGEDVDNISVGAGVKEEGVHHAGSTVGALAHGGELTRLVLVHHLSVHAVGRDHVVDQTRQVADSRRGSPDHDVHGGEATACEAAAFFIEGVGDIAGDAIPIIERASESLGKRGVGCRLEPSGFQIEDLQQM